MQESRVVSVELDMTQNHMQILFSHSKYLPKRIA
jgi:hypothetical protein